MSTAAADRPPLTGDYPPVSGDDWTDLVRLREAIDTPKGCWVEIVEWGITVAPLPSTYHNATANLLQRPLYSVIPEDWGIYQMLGVAVPACGGLFVPDLAVMPEAALEAPGNHVSATEAHLVVEITSRSNARHDRIVKPAAYAHAGVPLYLLVDAWAPGGPTVTLYGEPKGEVCRVLHAVKFGDKLRLPEPFGLTVDTGTFPVS